MSNKKAEALKEEGNALFVKKEFTLAAKKYSAAIAEDGQNAVYYANRSACLLSLDKCLDAEADAKRATELDPSYTKAWARKATAMMRLGDIPDAIKAWKEALNTLPKENPNPSELKQKEQYETSLKTAEAALVEVRTMFQQHAIIINKDRGKLPWEAAKEMIPTLAQSRSPKSSAWVINAAYNEFSEGVRLMKAMKTVPTRQGPAAVGNLGALASISNGITRDDRVFHLTDNDFISEYNNQVRFEAKKWNAWTEGGPDIILESAQKRVLEDGWKNVRPALAVTVRALVMRGFLETNMHHHATAGATFLSEALAILERGRKLWKDVPKDDRGVIFESTFIRGVRSMALETLVQAYDPSPNSKFTLQRILDEADKIIDEEDTREKNPADPGFIYSFEVYPVAKALSSKGFCHGKMARLNMDPEDVLKAAILYAKAAEMFPEDDEFHAYFLYTALQHYSDCGAPLSLTLEISKRIRTAVPKMREIWTQSPLAMSGGHAGLDKVLKVEEIALQGLKEGKMTLEDPFEWSIR